MLKLSHRQIATLQNAARDGRVDVWGINGFVRAASRKRIAKLASLGLLEPSPFNDWYIPDAGRAVLAEQVPA